jgi:hypothetical protein
VHFFKRQTRVVRRDQDWREGPGNTGRSHEDAAEQRQGLRSAVRRDCPHVPTDAALGIEVRRRNQKHAPFCIFRRHGGQDVGIHIAFDEIPQRFGPVDA